MPSSHVLLSLIYGATVAADHARAVPAMHWVDALTLGVGGRAFESNAGNLTFARWPAAAQHDLNTGEYSYGLDSAGMFVDFTSNATSISVNYTLRSLFEPYTTPFNTLSPLGSSGVDLYARDSSSKAWRWVASSFAGLEGAKDGVVVERPLFANASGWPVGPFPVAATWAGTTTYRLHFPQYNGVMSLAVGVPVGATITADRSWNESAPVLYLGTSITQGGCTERPGQAYVARLSATLSRPVSNYGLCGSCRLEPGLAKWVTAIPRVPSILAIDCTANMDVPLVAANTAPFVRAIRKAWGAALPIVLVEPIDDTPSWLEGNVTYDRPGLRAALRAAYEELVAGGDTSLTYVPAAALRVGADGATEELTVEGVHPLDRGHALIASGLHDVLAPLLATAPPERSAVTPLGYDDATRASLWPSSQGSSFTALDSAPLPGSYARAPTDADDLVWTDASLLTIVGRAFPASSLPSPYARLPSAAHGVVRDAVWALSLNSAGLAVAFETDAPSVWVNYSLASPVAPMVHFPATGISGADLFAWDPATQHWRFVAPASPALGATIVAQQMTRPNVNVTSRGNPIRYLLFLATYASVTAISVGTSAGSLIQPIAPFAPADTRPIVWYGTSILQGGVSTKVGNIETARVSIALNREVMNLGFSGNCKMEESVARFLVQIPDPAAIIVDCM